MSRIKTRHINSINLKLINYGRNIRKIKRVKTIY